MKAVELCPWRPRNGFLKYTHKVRRLWDKDIIINMTSKMALDETPPALCSFKLSMSFFFFVSESIYFSSCDFKGQMYYLVYKISAQQKNLCSVIYNIVNSKMMLWRQLHWDLLFWVLLKLLLHLIQFDHECLRQSEESCCGGVFAVSS